MKFKPIFYNPNYLISDTGVVKNSITGQILKQQLSKEGYYRVTIISVYRKPIKLQVHRLVAQAFCYKPEGCDIVNHKDEVKTNNNASNLEWCTTKYNHDYGNALIKLGRSLSIPIVRECDNIKYIYRSAQIASKILNIPRQSINNVVNNKRNSVFGLKFRKATKNEIEKLGENIDYLEVKIKD